jgi:Lon protease-like protein
VDQHRLHGRPLHRCTLAHYLADLYDDPALALTWDIRALDAADAITDERVQQHDASLHIAGFYPSLHLNLADNYRRLASFDTAAEHINAARNHSPALPQDSYGDDIRAAITDVAVAIANHDTAARRSVPGAGS